MNSIITKEQETLNDLKNISLEIKYKLIEKAIKKYKSINTIPKKNSFAECFTTFDNIILFWFNDKYNSTHTTRHDIQN